MTEAVFCPENRLVSKELHFSLLFISLIEWLIYLTLSSSGSVITQITARLSVSEGPGGCHSGIMGKKKKDTKS